MINPLFFRTAAMSASCAISIFALSAQAESLRESRLLDSQWKFSLTPDSASSVSPYTKTVDLPHDWSIEHPFDRTAPSGNDGGYVCTGKGVYTKEMDFTAKQLEGARYSLLFEGVYERWSVKVNGETVGFRPYGYSSVIYDITPYLHPGKIQSRLTSIIQIRKIAVGSPAPAYIAT